MAYVHCHNCPWSQDDFWNKKYNPVRYFLKTDIPTWIVPCHIQADPELVRPNFFTRSLGLTRVWEEPWGDPDTLVEFQSVFTWLILARNFWRRITSLFTQVWWTKTSWAKAIQENGNKWPVCPSCGADALDID